MSPQELFFPGNCPGKNIGRRFFYEDLAKRCTPDRFRNGKHIHIMSYEGGDYHYLNSIGIKVSQQLTCDRDCHGRNLAYQYRVPMAPEGICDDIVRTVKWALRHNEIISTINVDFCNTLQSNECKLAITEILNLVYNDSSVWVSLTFKRGREPGWKADDRWNALAMPIRNKRIHPGYLFEYQNGVANPMTIAIWGPHDPKSYVDNTYLSRVWHETPNASYARGPRIEKESK